MEFSGSRWKKEKCEVTLAAFHNATRGWGHILLYKENHRASCSSVSPKNRSVYPRLCKIEWKSWRYKGHIRNRKSNYASGPCQSMTRNLILHNQRALWYFEVSKRTNFWKSFLLLDLFLFYFFTTVHTHWSEKSTFIFDESKNGILQTNRTT